MVITTRKMELPLTVQQNVCRSWRSIFQIVSSAGERSVLRLPLDFWMRGEIYAVIKDEKPESIAVLEEIINNCTRRMDRDKVLRATTSSFLRRVEICATSGGSHFAADL